MSPEVTKRMNEQYHQIRNQRIQKQQKPENKNKNQNNEKQNKNYNAINTVVESIPSVVNTIGGVISWIPTMTSLFSKTTMTKPQEQVEAFSFGAMETEIRIEEIKDLINSRKDVTPESKRNLVDELYRASWSCKDHETEMKVLNNFENKFRSALKTQSKVYAREIYPNMNLAAKPEPKLEVKTDNKDLLLEEIQQAYAIYERNLEEKLLEQNRLAEKAQTAMYLAKLEKELIQQNLLAEKVQAQIQAKYVADLEVKLQQQNNLAKRIELAVADAKSKHDAKVKLELEAEAIAAAKRRQVNETELQWKIRMAKDEFEPKEGKIDGFYEQYPGNGKCKHCYDPEMDRSDYFTRKRAGLSSAVLEDYLIDLDGEVNEFVKI